VLYFTRALYVVPEGGGDPIRYSDVIGLPLYPDMNEIFTGSAIYNLTNHSYHNIASHANFQDCGVYSGSIDQNNYTLKCCDGNLYVASTDEETKTRINLRSSDSDRFEGPIWSPDGEWISYLRTIPDPNDYSSEGKAQLFLVKTDCLSDPGSCPLLTRGPIEGDFFVGTAPYGWSPDSRYLAIPSMSATSILIYDLQTNTIRRILWETGVYSVAWSPDGAWLAFSGYASSNQAALAIYVMPESGGQARLLVSDIEDTTILYWMRAP
jgi:WD40 repeat protein